MIFQTETLPPFLIPIDPEPIGIGLYAFWFAGLFSILALVWEAGKRLKLRVFLTVIGGLSAPLGISVMPLFVMRAVWTRNRHDVVTAAASLATTSTQLWFVFSAGASNPSNVASLFDDPYENILVFITKFVSKFFWEREPLTLLGIAVSFVAAVYVWQDARRKNYTALALITCAIISALLSIIRVPLEAIDPMGNGPRYFFYPYIFIAWAMLAFAGTALRRNGLAAAGLLVLLNTATFFSRTHGDLDWKGAAKECLASPDGAILPVHLNGINEMAWSVTLSQEDCKKLERISLF